MSVTPPDPATPAPAAPPIAPAAAPAPRLSERLRTMSVPEKIKLALLGDREARTTLIGDSSRQVQEAVLKSPKITESEIEKIAGMRNVDVEILRVLARSRENLKSYGVVHALVKNPKTPAALGMQLVPRLQDRDLKLLMKDRNVPEVLRRHAKIVATKRQGRGG